MMLSVPRHVLTLWRGVGIVLTISLPGVAIELLKLLLGSTTSFLSITENEIDIVGGIAVFRGRLFCRKSQDYGEQ